MFAKIVALQSSVNTCTVHVLIVAAILYNQGTPKYTEIQPSMS